MNNNLYNVTQQKIYIEYSHEIDFDFSTGEYPSGNEADWDWEEVYIPVEHEFNGKKVSKHSYMRIKVGIDNIWSYPIFISTSRELDITAQNPIKFDSKTGIFSHSTDDGDKHIPKGGSKDYILSTDGNGNYSWVKNSNSGGNGDYYTKIELQTSGQAQVHWGNITDVPSIVGLYTNLNPTPSTIGGIVAGSTFVNQNMQDMWDALLYPYQTPSFTSFFIASQSTSLEVGTILTGGIRTFNWSTSNQGNIVYNSISIIDVTNNNVLGNNLNNTGATGLPIGSDISKTTNTSHQWKIEATNTKGNNFSRTYNVNWYWGLYYGESSNTILTGNEVSSLRVKQLTNTITGNYVYLAGGFKYIAHVSTLGTLTSFVDSDTGFAVPFESPYVISVTNINGITIDYKVYRSTYQLGSSISINMS
jgi:hypothetical protein